MSENKEKTDELQKEVIEEKVNETSDEPKAELKVEPKEPVEVWDEADLVSICGQCGEVTKVATYEGGVQWIVVTRSDSVFEVKCPKCKNQMTLRFQDGRKFTEKELEEKRKAAQELIDKASAENEKRKQELDEAQEKLDIEKSKNALKIVEDKDEPQKESNK